jgi:hypothetical protein
MSIGRPFFRIMAACSAAAAFGVLLAQLGLNHYPQPEAPPDAIALYSNPVFVAQSWTILIQVFLMFLALWGATVKMIRRGTALIATGFLIFTFWQGLELIPRSIDLFAGSYDWSPAYLAATEDVERATLAAQFRWLDDVSSAIRDVRSPLWGLGHLLFGLAFWQLGGWKRAISVLFLFNAVRLALGMIGRSIGPAWLAAGGLPMFIIGMVPLFTLLAIWMWTEPHPEEPGNSR